MLSPTQGVARSAGQCRCGSRGPGSELAASALSRRCRSYMVHQVPAQPRCSVSCVGSGVSLIYLADLCSIPFRVAHQLAQGPASQLSWSQVRKHDPYLSRYSEWLLGDKWVLLIELANREVRQAKQESDPKCEHRYISHHLQPHRQSD